MSDLLKWPLRHTLLLSFAAALMLASCTKTEPARTAPTPPDDQETATNTAEPEAPAEPAPEPEAPPPVEPEPEAEPEPPAFDPTAPVVRQPPRVRRERADNEALGVDIAIEDRDGQSMAPLHAALRRVAGGEGKARLVFYGASHVASDYLSGHFRIELQKRFGDAGHGIIVPAHPWRTYRHRGITLESEHRQWNGQRIRATSTEGGAYGVAGTYVETSERARTRVMPPRAGDVGFNSGVFELYYYTQPGGGAFDVFIDNRKQERIETTADTPAAAYSEYRVEDGRHRFEIRTRGNGPVRLFGLSVERDVPGVVVDTLGINGARARYHLMWDDTIYQEHLRKREPNLVVLAYGTNESGDDTPIEDYEANLTRVVTRMREAVPDAACLLIGPSDRPMQPSETGAQINMPRPRTAQIIEVQHRVSVRQGCGFFDIVAFMGGEMSMTRWADHNPAWARPDLVHFTRRGYQRLAQVLFEAVMDGYGELPPVRED